MKKLLIILFIVSAFSLQAQEGLTWQTDLNKAIEISKQENKPMFLFFTGSDWCGWCHRLQDEVFKTPEFIAWAKEKVVLLELDFPRRTQQSAELKQQNNQLQQAFAVRGYPTVWFVKPTEKDGKTNFEQLGSTGYVAGGPNSWLIGANQIISRYVPDVKPTKEEQKQIEKTEKKAVKSAKKAVKKS